MDKKLTKEMFFAPFDGHGNAYSSYMLIGVTVDEVINMFNKTNLVEYAESIGSGKYDEAGGSVSFEICKETPALIYDMTGILNCKGFADMDTWYGTPCFLAADNSKDYDDFTAKWETDNPYEYEDDGIWDAFFSVTDKKSGAVFHTGFGAVDEETKEHMEEIVIQHLLRRRQAYVS